MPLYFERQITKDSGASHKLPHFDTNIRNNKWKVIALQTLLTITGLSFSVYVGFRWIKSIDGIWNPFKIFNWSLTYDWQSDSMQLLAESACLNVISLFVILAGLLIVKKWIEDEFIGERTWRCSVDGNFLVYFILILTFFEALKPF